MSPVTREGHVTVACAGHRENTDTGSIFDATLAQIKAFISECEAEGIPLDTRIDLSGNVPTATAKRDVAP